MKETQEEREATLAYNNPWVLNYVHQHNKKIKHHKNKQTNQNPHQNSLSYLFLEVLYVWISF